jgi:hypothetical protein
MLDMRQIGIATAIAWFLLAGCASDIELGISYDPLTVFPAQATYAWDEGSSSLPTDDRIEALNLDPLIKQVVDSEFATKGYRPVRAGEPRNYLLSYQLGVATRIRPEESFSMGSLYLDLNDAASGRRVWVGFARTQVDPSRSEQERVERLRETVRRMLEKFPPGQHD